MLLNQKRILGFDSKWLVSKITEVKVIRRKLLVKDNSISVVSWRNLLWVYNGCDLETRWTGKWEWSSILAIFVLEKYFPNWLCYVVWNEKGLLNLPNTQKNADYLTENKPFHQSSNGIRQKKWLRKMMIVSGCVFLVVISLKKSVLNNYQMISRTRCLVLVIRVNQI